MEKRGESILSNFDARASFLNLEEPRPRLIKRPLLDGLCIVFIIAARKKGEGGEKGKKREKRAAIIEWQR